MYISQLQLSWLILPSRTQAENRQYIFCVELNSSSGTQPRKLSALQEESSSETQSSGSPYASSIHLHDDDSQPSEHSSGNNVSVSKTAGVKFCPAAKWLDKITVAANNFFMSVAECICCLAPSIYLSLYVVLGRSFCICHYRQIT